MAMKELLRISMSPKQVREACEAWADCHALVKEEATIDANVASDGSAIVVFSKKRERKPKGGNGETSNTGP